ncbi:MAG: hypothetical protein SGI94_23240 [Saprospiraceae bacterium]|nr:hypothetical protein [Saprospiraceae bacterium]
MLGYLAGGMTTEEILADFSFLEKRMFWRRWLLRPCTADLPISGIAFSIRRSAPAPHNST